MNWNFLIQAFIALLVGAIVFYIAAPHSWGVGVFIQEPIYAAISLGISLAILIPSGLVIFRKKQKYFLSMFLFSFIGIVLVVYFYQAPYRYTKPPDSIKEDIEASLQKLDLPPNLSVSMGYRSKQPFDLFVEHSWTVTVWGENPLNYKTFTYVEHFGKGELKISKEVDWSELTK
ncbi:hypothetical protein [Kangiella sp.]|uniref:hypothetical protein n=1 Tax=Kangiella sp. TaxID=1920245 RepID=UPI00198B6CEF|nr:hypothetical protein [Kangiella sp.]MBD3652960.1 hypothetical protein [Kangiella sp.]